MSEHTSTLFGHSVLKDPASKELMLVKIALFAHDDGRSEVHIENFDSGERQVLKYDAGSQVHEMIDAIREVSDLEKLTKSS